MKTNIVDPSADHINFTNNWLSLICLQLTILLLPSIGPSVRQSYVQVRKINRLLPITAPSALLGMMPWPTPIFGCNMTILVATGINCI
jgi:hypothetical protein